MNCELLKKINETQPLFLVVLATAVVLLFFFSLIQHWSPRLDHLLVLSIEMAGLKDLLAGLSICS